MTNLLERPVQPIQMRRSALRAHAAGLRILRDSPDRARVEMRGRYDASRPLRGHARAVDRLARSLEYAQGLGHGHSEAPGHAEGGPGCEFRSADNLASDDIVRMLRRARVARLNC